MNASDTQLLLQAAQALTEARIKLNRLSASAKQELTEGNHKIFAEIEQIQNMLDNKWIDARRAAAALGSKGGLANTPAQNAARARNAKHAGRKKGSKNKPKDSHAR